MHNDHISPVRPVVTKPALASRIGYYVISTGLLVYGALRLIGAIPGLGQAMGWSDTEIGRNIVAKLASSLPEMSERAILPMSLATYIGWSGLMGFLLTVGSVLALFRRKSGFWLMGAFFALFAFGFVNYLVVNVKLVHFAVALSLFLLMLRLAKPGADTTVNSSSLG